MEGVGQGGYLEVRDGILADLFIGEQTLELLVRLLAAGQVACICCSTPYTMQSRNVQQASNMTAHSGPQFNKWAVLSELAEASVIN